ncbi:ABC transporter ATP-binding protein [Haloglomus halophilum]|uniref:ABC transporter ATP-binding protein n=1 Tax=Haloglomus halophilum TaxID=2962672 RepID=UPI0020C9E9F7|nr:ABC transporter ATP-binding protein [Haloglomus halophilum]
MTEGITTREKLSALRQVAGYRPALTAGIICLSFFAAVLEGIGLSFLLPIIETAQSSGQPPQGGIVGVFVTVYDFLGIPFTLEFIIFGVAGVMTARYTSSFLVDWLRAKLQTEYIRHLQTESFDRALDAQIAYFDVQGSDAILNTIVTQSRYAGRVIERVVKVVEQGLLSGIYLGIALLLAPVFTIVSGAILGSVLYGLRWLVESGYDVGDRVATANEQVQNAVQAGMQGIRDVKLFGLREELFGDFKQSVDQFENSSIKLRRNQAALDNFYQLATAITVFGLIYGAFRFSSLSLAGLGVFLFAMFRLSPRISTLNNTIYQLEGELPHLVRTQKFICELESAQEPNKGDRPVPEPIEETRFEDVQFAYDSTEQVLDGVSFAVERGEFVAFVGPSGAGKSTIVSLLTRMYDPDEGTITANGTDISEFPIEAWRDRISVVRQNPYVFNDTLRYNITIGARDVSASELERVCEIAQVTEFLDELPEGYNTVLGDEGVKLSGGQRQRVSVARALLKDADFLVLDEATSDLDSNIEESMHQAIESMDRDYAMLVIAHRLSTIVSADRIYTMEGGVIVESGQHGELIEQDGTYANLYATQTG